jgi:hypothetical protein
MLSLQEVKAKLHAVAPTAVILERFVGPEELAAIYSKTRLNVHTATYDAFGMTVVEAASQVCCRGRLPFGCSHHSPQHGVWWKVTSLSTG